MKRFILLGIRTKLEWQLAYQAAQHAEGGRRLYLTYGTPDGDVTLSVQRHKNDITIRRNGNA